MIGNKTTNDTSLWLLVSNLQQYTMIQLSDYLMNVLQVAKMHQ